MQVLHGFSCQAVIQCEDSFFGQFSDWIIGVALYIIPLVVFGASLLQRMKFSLLPLLVSDCFSTRSMVASYTLPCGLSLVHTPLHFFARLGVNSFRSHSANLLALFPSFGLESISMIKPHTYVSLSKPNSWYSY